MFLLLRNVQILGLHNHPWMYPPKISPTFEGRMMPVDNPREVISCAQILWFVLTLEGQCCIKASLGMKFVCISEHVTVV